MKNLKTKCSLAMMLIMLVSMNQMVSAQSNRMADSKRTGPNTFVITHNADVDMAAKQAQAKKEWEAIEGVTTADVNVVAGKTTLTIDNTKLSKGQQKRIARGQSPTIKRNYTNFVRPKRFTIPGTAGNGKVKGEGGKNQMSVDATMQELINRRKAATTKEEKIAISKELRAYKKAKRGTPKPTGAAKAKRPTNTKKQGLTAEKRADKRAAFIAKVKENLKGKKSADKIIKNLEKLNK